MNVFNKQLLAWIHFRILIPALVGFGPEAALSFDYPRSERALQDQTTDRWSNSEGASIPGFIKFWILAEEIGTDSERDALEDEVTSDSQAAYFNRSATQLSFQYHGEACIEYKPKAYLLFHHWKLDCNRA